MELKNITLEELQRFYEELGTEKQYIDDPTTSTPEFVFGLWQDGELAGISALKTHYRFFHSSLKIVKTKFQRRGYSTKLKNEIISYARRKSYSLVIASVRKDNTAAVAMDLKHGHKLLYTSARYCRFGYPLNRRGEILCWIMPVLYGAYYYFNKIIRGQQW